MGDRAQAYPVTPATAGPKIRHPHTLSSVDESSTAVDESSPPPSKLSDSPSKFNDTPSKSSDDGSPPVPRSIRRGSNWRYLVKSQAPWVSLCKELALAAFVILIFALVLSDLFHRGLGKNNGWFVSAIDSINTCFGYRTQRPHTFDHVQERTRERRETFVRRASLFHAGRALQKGGDDGCGGRTLRAYAVALWILLNNSLVKFGPATLVSLALGQTPVVLKGVRHSTSFIVALLAVQLSPADVAFRLLALGPVQAAIAFAVSLYKLRKACFVVEAVAAADRSLPVGAILMWLVIDGTSVARKCTNVLTAGADGATRRVSARAVGLEAVDVVAATARALRSHLLLLVLLLQAGHVTRSVDAFAALGVPAAAAARCELGARALTLAYLIRRYRAHEKARVAYAAAKALLRDVSGQWSLSGRWSSPGKPKAD